MTEKTSTAGCVEGYTYRMSEYDDNKKWKDKVDRARRDPSVSPNFKYELEKQVKKGEKQKLATLQKEMARKQLNDKQKKLKDEMNKKGIQNVDTKPDAKQQIDNAKRREEADKAQGQTEKPTQTV